MKKLYFVFALLLLLQFNASAQFEYYDSKNYSNTFFEELTNTTNVDLDSLMLDSIITAYKDSLSIPGIATLIIKDNEIIWNKNYGYRNVESQLPVEDTTLFFIASISKTITATAVMQLWENGLFDLNDNINDYLPSGFTVVNPYHQSDIITVKMLMTHTSSLLDNWNILLPVISCGDSPIDLQTFLIGYLTPGGKYYNQNNFGNYIPGQRWNYTSVGTGLLALMIENITGKSFDEYCRDSIFIPLSMNSTSWFLKGLDLNSIATPYIDLDPVCHPGWPLYPGGFLRTSKTDFSKFLLAYLNNGTYNNRRILDSTTISYMLSDQLGLPATYASPWWVYRQGLIWFNAFPINNSGWGHAGSWPGCLTYFSYDPIEKWGTIWFQNWRPVAQVWIQSLGAINHQFTKYANLYRNIYALHPEVDKSYSRINVDSVLFRTGFSNVYNHPFTPHLIYANHDSTLTDSLILFDDGVHGDLLPNDGIYGGYIAPIPVEDFIRLSVSTINNQTNKYFKTPDICRFTTSGPVLIDSLVIKKLQTVYSLKVFATNNGSETIDDIKIKITCSDPWVSGIGNSELTLGSLEPGLPKGTTSAARISYIDSLFEDSLSEMYFNIRAEFMIDGWTYWMDTIRVYDPVPLFIEDLAGPVPDQFSLSQNYPNPFNPETKIRFSIPYSSKVEISIYDLLGSKVETILDEDQTAGNYEATWNAASLPSGIYFYQLKAGEFVETKKMILLK